MKRFLETGEASTSKKTKSESESSSGFLTSLHKNRLKTAESISDFKFNKKRVKILSKVGKIFLKFFLLANSTSNRLRT